MRLHMGGQRIQRGLQARVVVRSGSGAEAGKKGRPETVVAEHSVQVAARNAPVSRNRPLGPPVHPGEGAISIGAVGAADMDLVAAERSAGFEMHRSNLGQALV